MTYQNILFSIEGGIARITLNRPDRLNSFNGEMHLELRDALAQTRDKHARVLLLTGAGRGFCAGQDLADRNVSVGSDPVDLGYTIETFYKPLILSLRALEMPVICAVNGVAAGAGASIALACDIVLAARSASFIQAFCKLGLVPDAGGTWVLPRLVGTARAMGLAMLGDKLSAEQAESWGLIWKCLDDDKLMAEAEKIATFICDAVRTPIGRYGRRPRDRAPDDLAAAPDQGADGDASGPSTGAPSTTSSTAAPTRPARTTATSRGWPACSPACRSDVPAATINRLCGSGMDAVGTAARAIKAGEIELGSPAASRACRAHRS
jgi:2-(1,2-epoxy-1,2-dihydrophenyl)acetyl-CoA isomerase